MKKFKICIILIFFLILVILLLISRFVISFNSDNKFVREKILVSQSDFTENTGFRLPGEIPKSAKVSYLFLGGGMQSYKIYVMVSGANVESDVWKRTLERLPESEGLNRNLELHNFPSDGSPQWWISHEENTAEYFSSQDEFSNWRLWIPNSSDEIFLYKSD